MLHLHFGTGRLGLGLVAPFFKTPSSELYLLNRASSGRNPTGSTALEPARRNDLLKNSTRYEYLIETPGFAVRNAAEPRQRVQYHGFFAYKDEEVESLVENILRDTQAASHGIVVSASVITVKNYEPVIAALDAICQATERDENKLGSVYLIACENTVDAHEIFETEELQAKIDRATRKHVRCVRALVDRVCVEMEECSFQGASSAQTWWRAESRARTSFCLPPAG